MISSRQLVLQLSVLSAFIFIVNSFQSICNSYYTSSQWIKPHISKSSYVPLSRKNWLNSFTLRETMESSNEVLSSNSNIKLDNIDFSQFAVGQEYEAKLISAKKFGVFVDIGKGLDVLLPRSIMTPTSYDKLSRLVTDKSTAKVRIELTNVSPENRTLSGRFLPDNFRSRPSLSDAVSKDLETKVFNATVVSIHDFGIFAALDDIGVEGLIPISKLPEGTSKANVKTNFEKGMRLVVRVEVVNLEERKLIFTARLNDNRIDVTKSTLPGSMSPEKWIQGVVQNVASFGVFIRPAGMDTVGLLHQSRIPRELTSALKKLSPIVPGTNKSDVENLFSSGDIFKFRVQSLNPETKKMELSCLPFKSNEDEEDDFVIIEDEDEGKEGKKGRRDDAELVADDSVTDESGSSSALDVLIWWRGKSFDKSLVRGSSDSDNLKDDELEVISESKDVREGTWRRLFEIDMRQDEADFSAKAMEAEMREMEEEIGELNGIDQDLENDMFGLGTKRSGNRVGNLALSSIPAEWRDQLDFFKELDSSTKAKSAVLKGGKKFEIAEQEALNREMEASAVASSARPRRSEVSSEVLPPAAIPASEPVVIAEVPPVEAV